MIKLVKSMLPAKKKHVKTLESSGMPVRSDKAILKELFRIAIPVSLGASVMSLVNLIDGYSLPIQFIGDGKRKLPFGNGWFFCYVADNRIGGYRQNSHDKNNDR